MSLRKSTQLFTFITFNALLMCLMFIHAHFNRAAAATSLEEKRRLVNKLELTDLCLFTEARYTRHPAMADQFSPFQDHPFALDHFPSGSLLSLPPHLKRHP
jgi:hypothetical protein